MTQRELLIWPQNAVMIRLYLGLAFVWTLASPAVAVAAPLAYYNPMSGNVTVRNDYAVTLPFVTVSSMSGSLRNPANVLPIPGAIVDSQDFPTTYVYLNFPPGVYDTGNTFIVGTPVSDVVFEYFSLAGPPVSGPVVEVPEPTGGILALLTLLSVGHAGAWRRR